jgi:hypothetical protein
MGTNYRLKSIRKWKRERGRKGTKVGVKRENCY